MVAAYRGRASARGSLIDDPFAARLAGPEGEADADAYEAAHSHVELFIALRTAFLDDAVRRAMAESIAQVVILGAGYDTRAARLATPGVRFFEVDRERTQADKRARLATIEGYPQDAATYVSCDFEHDDFLDRLSAEGLDLDAPTVFVWEGVVYYLGEDAARATLARIAGGTHPRSRLFFDSVGKRFVAGRVNDLDDLEARDAVARMGEPLRFGVDDPVPLLSEAGFRHVRTVSIDEACLSYTGTYDRSRKFRFQSLVEARVEPPERP